MSRTRSLRGVVVPSGGKVDVNLFLDDGRINQGYKIRAFYVWPSQVSIEARQYNAILSYATLPASAVMDAADNRQIAWAWNIQSEFTPLPTPAALGITTAQQLIDEDHLVNRDLYLTMRNATDNEPFNYMVVMDEYSLNDAEAIVTIIKETSQSIE